MLQLILDLKIYLYKSVSGILFLSEGDLILEGGTNAGPLLKCLPKV